jgi:hypothetical protein
MERIDHTRVEVCDEKVLAEVERLFNYQRWDEDQISAGANVRNSLSAAYRMVLNYVPPSPTRTRALNAILDARMLANQAITFKGAV